MKKRFYTVLVAALVMVPLFAQDDFDYAASLFENGAVNVEMSGRTNTTFNSLQDVVNALPAFPKTEDVVTPGQKEALLKSSLHPYTVAYRKLEEKWAKESLELNRKQQELVSQQRQKVQQQQQTIQRASEQGLMPSPQEMMQIVMSSGIDMEHATDAQIMDVVADACAKKWGISKQEYMKIVNMAQRNPTQAENYMRQNHPALYNKLKGLKGTDMAMENDTRDGEFAEIQGQLAELTQEISKTAEEYTQVLKKVQAEGVDYDISHLQGYALYGKFSDIFKAWKASSEYAQINEHERALYSRVWDKWLPSLHTTADEVAYPAWWTTQRKQDNQLVENFNKRMAPQWLAVPQAQRDKLMVLFKKVASLEQKNEQLRQQGDISILYITNKQSIFSILSLFHHVLRTYDDAISFPCVSHMAEEGTISLGKG